MPAQSPAQPSAQPTAQTPAQAPASAVRTIPGMPPVPDPSNLYSEQVAGKLSAAVAGHLERVYVPNRSDRTVSVVDPVTMAVLDTFRVGVDPQHVVPSWDLKTLWVANNAEGRRDGSLTPIDPLTGRPGKSIPVDDPYNMYFTADGRYAIIVAEAHARLDFRDPHTMKLEFSLPTPACSGINHADFSIDGRYAAFTCEFGGGLTKIDLVERKVVATIRLSTQFGRAGAQQMRQMAHSMTGFSHDTHGAMPGEGMPQDVRVSPDGTRLYVADMMADGVHVVDFASFRQVGFIPTGVGTHGLYPSRDGKYLYVANRGSHRIHGKRHGPGSVAVIDFATEKVISTWPIPGGGSPDMGNVSADGRYLWLSGRYDDEVYRIDTRDGAVARVKVGREPHGLTVWPQPGRYSLGHTGNMR
ncbi:MAG TPA: YncE family protein [Ramlibacter sp.]|nr:YncE family protein [Ramlibacter sp.]HVZ46231.1 YncE family protein [Ramlibacter sp.]